jgi:hypothetical protein
MRVFTFDPPLTFSHLKPPVYTSPEPPTLHLCPHILPIPHTSPMSPALHLCPPHFTYFPHPSPISPTLHLYPHTSPIPPTLHLCPHTSPMSPHFTWTRAHFHFINFQSENLQCALHFSPKTPHLIFYF